MIWNGEAVEVFLDPIPCGIPLYHFTISVASQIYSGEARQLASGDWLYEATDTGELQREFELVVLDILAWVFADICPLQIEPEDDQSGHAE
jgi:hypothetical protein